MLICYGRHQGFVDMYMAIDCIIELSHSSFFLFYCNLQTQTNGFQETI